MCLPLLPVGFSPSPAGGAYTRSNGSLEPFCGHHGSLLCRVLASLNILFGVMMSREDKEIPIIDDNIIEEGLNKNLSDKKARAVEVLEQQMNYYHFEAEGIIAQIILILKEDKKPRGDMLALMYKKFEQCAEKARECAAKLAPYQSPRLESIETKTEVEHRFVVRIPNKYENSQEWLTAAQEELKQIPQTEIVE